MQSEYRIKIHPTILSLTVLQIANVFVIGNLHLDLMLSAFLHIAKGAASMSLSVRSNALLIILVVCLFIAASTFVAYASGQDSSLAISPAQTRTARALNPVSTRTRTTGGFAATLTALAPTNKARQSAYHATATALSGTASALTGKLSGTATAFAATVTAVSVKLQRTVLPTDEAASAIANYGAAVLGISIPVVSAHGVNEYINGTYSLPGYITQALTVSPNLAVQSYTAVLSNGTAWLAYGNGTSSINNSPTYSVDTESLAVYTLSIKGSVTNAQTAQALALATYPGLAGKTYAPATATQGYAFYSYTSVTALDPQTGKLTLMPEAIVLYVLPGKNGQVAVTAAIGSGQYSSLLEP
jgi:hypothetical protein